MNESSVFFLSDSKISPVFWQSLLGQFQVLLKLNYIIVNGFCVITLRGIWNVILTRVVTLRVFNVINMFGMSGCEVTPTRWCSHEVVSLELDISVNPSIFIRGIIDVVITGVLLLQLLPVFGSISLVEST